MKRAALMALAAFALAVAVPIAGDAQTDGAHRSMGQRGEGGQIRAAMQKLSPADKQRVRDIQQQIRQLRAQQFQILGIPEPSRRRGPSGEGLD